MEYCSFIKALCQALYDLINHWIIENKIQQGTIAPIGIVSEKYRGNIAVVKAINTTFKVNDNLFFINETNCFESKVLSIQDQGNSLSEISVDYEKEIGIKTSIQVPLNSKIIKYNY